MPAKLAVVVVVVVFVVNGENGKPPLNRFQVSMLLRGNVYIYIYTGFNGFLETTSWC